MIKCTYIPSNRAHLNQKNVLAIIQMARLRSSPLDVILKADKEVSNKATHPFIRV